MRFEKCVAGRRFSCESGRWPISGLGFSGKSWPLTSDPLASIRMV